MMKTALKALGITAFAAALIAGSVANVVAAPIVSLSPSSQTVGVGEAFSVDVIVSGLSGNADEAIGGFGFTLSFSDALIEGASYVADPDNLMGVEDDLSFGFTGAGGSPLDVFVAADAALDGAALAAVQGVGFRLMTINFISGMVDGLSPLTFSFATLSDAPGVDLPATVVNGSVCVDADGQNACPRVVPEPGLMALLATGLATAAVRRRRGQSKA
jgi:hypothetical protein